MDWKALLVMTALGSVQVINTYVRGNGLRRTVRTAMRELPPNVDLINVCIDDPRGPRATVQAENKQLGGRG